MGKNWQPTGVRYRTVTETIPKERVIENAKREIAHAKNKIKELRAEIKELRKTAKYATDMEVEHQIALHPGDEGYEDAPIEEVFCPLNYHGEYRGEYTWVNNDPSHRSCDDKSNPIES